MGEVSVAQRRRPAVPLGDIGLARIRLAAVKASLVAVATVRHI